MPRKGLIAREIPHPPGTQSPVAKNRSDLLSCLFDGRRRLLAMLLALLGVFGEFFSPLAEMSCHFLLLRGVQRIPDGQPFLVDLAKLRMGLFLRVFGLLQGLAWIDLACFALFSPGFPV